MSKIILNGIEYSATSSGSTALTDKLELKSDVSCQISSTNQDMTILKPLKVYGEPIILDADTSSVCLQVLRGTVFKGDNAYIEFDTINNGYTPHTKITKEKISAYKATIYQLNDAYNISTFSLNVEYIGYNNTDGNIKFSGNNIPATNNTHTLGNSSNKWKQLYANTSVISTSDRNLKKDIKNLDDKWIEFFMLLQPKSYMFKDGESGRTHVGFISQDVEEALETCGLTALDFAGFCKDQKIERKKEIEIVTHPAINENGESEWNEKKETEKIQPVFDKDGNPAYIYSLRYEEFIALNTMMIQKLYTQNKDFEDRLSQIEKLLIND